MKILYIILILLFSGFVFSQIYVTRSTNKTEQVKYKLLKRLEDGVEVRKYENLTVAYTRISSKNYSDVAGKGFRRIAGYIFGGNEENKSIAMTAPVQMSFSDTSEMMFFMPSSFKMSDLPFPSDSSVKLKQVKERIVAAYKFDGWASDEKIEQNKLKLINILEENGIEFDTNDFAYLGYNPPYQVVDRRNEIIVTLTDYKR